MANNMEFFVNTVWGAWSQAHEGLVKAKTEELQADKKQLEAEFVGNWRKQHQSLCHPTCAEFGRRKSVSKFWAPQNLSVYHHFYRCLMAILGYILPWHSHFVSVVRPKKSKKPRQTWRSRRASRSRVGKSGCSWGCRTGVEKDGYNYGDKIQKLWYDMI